MHPRFCPQPAGEEKQESAEDHAQRLGWTEEDLSRWRKGDARKVPLARQLRGETTMTLAWIAGRLQMGTASRVAFWLRKGV